MFLAERLGSRCACARSMEAVQIKEGCRRHQPTKTVVLVGSNRPGGGSITPRAFQALMVGSRPTTWSTSIRGVCHRDELPCPQEPAGLTTGTTSRWVARFCWVILIKTLVWLFGDVSASNSLRRHPPADEALTRSCTDSSALGFIFGCARHSIPSVQQNASRWGHSHAKVIPSGIQLFSTTVSHLHTQGQCRGSFSWLRLSSCRERKTKQIEIIDHIFWFSFLGSPESLQSSLC